MSTPAGLYALNERRARTCDAVGPLRRFGDILSVKSLAWRWAPRIRFELIPGRYPDSRCAELSSS